MGLFGGLGKGSGKSAATKSTDSKSTDRGGSLDLTKGSLDGDSMEGSSPGSKKVKVNAYSAITIGVDQSSSAQDSVDSSISLPSPGEQLSQMNKALKCSRDLARTLESPEKELFNRINDHIKQLMEKDSSNGPAIAKVKSEVARVRLGAALKLPHTLELEDQVKVALAVHCCAALQNVPLLPEVLAELASPNIKLGQIAECFTAQLKRYAELEASA